MSSTSARAASTPLLFETETGDEAVQATYSTGLLPTQSLRGLIQRREIIAEADIEEDQLQPASLDLRLGNRAYRVRASFLPGVDAKVADKIGGVAMHEVDLRPGAVLERGCVYVVPLQEHLKLSSRLSAAANPKSTSGRLDIFTRLIVDGATTFDRVPTGYQGPLYAEIAPRTFSVLVRSGDRLNQLRVRRGNPHRSDEKIRKLHARAPLVDSDEAIEADIDRGLALSVDLRGRDARSPIGYKARRHAGLIDLAKVDHYDPDAFWEPLYDASRDGLVLDPDDFYILASREAVTIPPDYAAEMLPYDPLVGEFRVHYAGFFDPGFGFAEAGGAGTRAVLEIRSHDVPFVLTHGQTVCRLVYERLLAPPEKIYGRDIGSNYQRQGLALSKHFRRRA